METGNIWILALVGVAVGLVIGYLLGRGGAGKQQLSQELDSTRAELESYKQEVTGHFETTAELVNGLTEQYRRVHQHLASGAQALCGDTQPAQSLAASLQPPEVQQEIPTVTDELPADEPATPLEPPRDYAPKTPDEAGMLSEQFSARPKPEDKTPPPVTPPVDPAIPAVEIEEPAATGAGTEGAKRS